MWRKPLPMPLEELHFQPTDGLPVQFRGYKLYERTSSEDNIIDDDNSLYVLTLYYEDCGLLCLTVEYRCQSSFLREHGKPRLDVVRNINYCDVANYLVSYDFAGPVNIDYYGSGHCCLMEVAAKLHFDLVTTFQLMAARFLEQVAVQRKVWWQYFDIRF
ncbi:MAG: hypothetical protein R6X35_12385 [Candidatus Krumholzibacteriia bacterium]